MFFLSVQGQELAAKVTVNAQALGSTADKQLINALEKSLTEFLNQKRWTNDIFANSEKIPCNFVINIQSVLNQNTFTASLLVQASRPVFNAIYQSSIVNYRDDLFTFKYQNGQRLDFNPNSVSVGDPLVANLTAVMAYYVYTILGFHYSTFALKAGEAHFKVAQTIVNNAPQDNTIKGWKLFDGQRTRYVLAENIGNIRFSDFYDCLYVYYRKGMDSLYEQMEEAQTQVLAALKKINTLREQHISNMLIPFFIENRHKEIVGIFANATPTVKKEVYDMMIVLDPSGLQHYKSLYK